MRSLRFQLFSFILALLLILLVLLNTYPLISSRDLVFKEKHSSMSSQAAVIASSLSGLDTLNQAGIEEVLRLLDTSGFGRIVVTNAEGVVLYDSGSLSRSENETEDIDAALSGKTVFRSRFAESAFFSTYAMPISSQGTTMGAVCLYEQDSDRASLILSVQRQIRVVSLVIAGLALALALIFVTLLLRRIRELVRSMHIVADGDYSHRLAVRGRDEISELGEEFNLLTERLDETERQRRRFVSDASHELKTPLASIRLLADSIVQNENIDPATVREFVTDIGDEAARLQRTTEKLLDLSRLDDDVQIVSEPVDIKLVAEDTMGILRPLAEGKQVRLLSELDEGCVVMASTDDMYHILFNLTENAIKYNVPDGQVLLTLHGNEASVILTVEDTGIGIPVEDRLNIFSRFYRVDKARSREAGGSGLGLSIVHDAVQTYGGSIAVEQNNPRGSRFIVTFPRPTSEETGI